MAPAPHETLVGVPSSGPARTMSLIPTRPPGRRTRAISANVASLSPDRTMTQFEMTTSTEASSSGICSMVPWRNSTLRRTGLGGVAAGEVEHLDGGVEPVGEAGRADPPGRQQHVDAAAGAEVQHGVAGLQVGDGDRVAAAEADAHRGVREAGEVVVVAGTERTVTAAQPSQASPASTRRAASA